MRQRHFASSRIATDRQRVSPALLTQKKQILGALGVLGGFLFEYLHTTINNPQPRRLCAVRLLREACRLPDQSELPGNLQTRRG